MNQQVHLSVRCVSLESAAEEFSLSQGAHLDFHLEGAKSTQSRSRPALSLSPRQRDERRTAVVNQIRSLLLERGITVRTGRCHLDEALPGILEDATLSLSGAVRLLLSQLKQEPEELARHLDQIDPVILLRRRRLAGRQLALPSESFASVRPRHWISWKTHITTLNPGEASHAPHRHPNEEASCVKVNAKPYRMADG